MDPWYFLDLGITNDNIELNDLSSIFPDGSWSLDISEYEEKIIFKDKEYNIIQFDNNTKILKCYGNQIDSYSINIFLINI